MDSSAVLSIIALVISVISAISATYVAQQSITEANHNISRQLFLELDKIFIENPEIRPVFYDDAPSPTDPAVFHRSEAVAEMILDVFIWVWNQRRGLLPSHASDWESYIVEMLTASKFLRQYHRQHPMWHADLDPLVQKAEQIRASGGR